VNRKISLMLIWCVSMLVACPGSGGNTGNTVSVEITGNPKDTTILLGASYDITAFAFNAKAEPDIAGTINLGFVSSDSSIASVSGKGAQGKVKALRVGTTTLIAKVGSIQSKPLQLKVIEFDPNAVPALPSTTTAVGKALGVNNKSVDIDSTGGTFSSNDGILTVVVPAGAVAAGTSVGFEITMLENKMPSGFGSAYRIGACCGGTLPTLLKPVELQFLAESDGLELDPNNLDVVFQGANGTWEATSDVLREPVVGTLAATRLKPLQKLSVTTEKLGDFTLQQNYSLTPTQASVKTGQSLKFTVIKTTRTTVSGEKSLSYHEFPASNWQVDDVTGGSQNAGQISPSAFNNFSATYKAPNLKPNPNMVKVSATVNDNGRTLNIYRIVKIEDSYAWMNVEFSGQVKKVSDPKITDYSWTLDGNVSANHFVDSETTEYTPPSLNYPGFGASTFMTKGAATDFYTAKLIYHYNFTGECICTPNAGTITRQVDVLFSANGSIPKNQLTTSLLWTVQTSGEHQAVVSFSPVTIEGDYTYHFGETYPCGDRAQRPSVTKQSKAKMFVSLVGTDNAFANGIVNPTSPGFINGAINGQAVFTEPTPVVAGIPGIPLDDLEFYGGLKASYWAEVGAATKSRLISPDALGVPAVPLNLPTPTVFPTSPNPKAEQKITPRC
jgi:hypothetical protein